MNDTVMRVPTVLCTATPRQAFSIVHSPPPLDLASASTPAQEAPHHGEGSRLGSGDLTMLRAKSITSLSTFKVLLILQSSFLILTIFSNPPPTPPPDDDHEEPRRNSTLLLGERVRR